MITTKTVIKFGNSKAITLPREIGSKLNFKDKVVFKIEILKVLKKKANLESDEFKKDYKCLGCGCIFNNNINKDDFMCPDCGNDDKNAFEEEKEINYFSVYRKTPSNLT